MGLIFRRTCGRCAAATLTLMILIALFAVPAIADDAQPNRIRIKYVQPKTPENQRIYEALKQHHALEKMQEIFSLFRLSNDLTIRTFECGMENAWLSAPDDNDLL